MLVLLLLLLLLLAGVVALCTCRLLQHTDDARLPHAQLCTHSQQPLLVCGRRHSRRTEELVHEVLDLLHFALVDLVVPAVLCARVVDIQKRAEALSF